MAHSLFLNLCILTSLIFLGSLLFRSPLIERLSMRNKKLIIGLLCGVLSNILMLNAIHISSSIIIDLRVIPLLFIAILGGFLPSLIAAIVTSAGRILFFDLHVDSATILAIANIFINVILGLFIIKLPWSNIKKLIFQLSLLMVISMGIILYLVGNLSAVWELFKPYSIAVASGSVFTYYLIHYLIQSHHAIEMFKLHASKDFLTGLNNVRSFDEIFNLHIQWSDRRNESLSLLLLDIDNFKKINDTYGHLAGDAILKQFGTLLPSAARSFDSVSRVGGEEFSIVLPDCPHSQALVVGERIRKAVETNVFHIPHKTISLQVTISIGVSTYKETVDQPEQVYKEADKALYKAKHQGRNQVCGATLNTKQ